VIDNTHDSTWCRLADDSVSLDSKWRNGSEG